MTDTIERHPLTTLLTRNRWTATGYLRKVADRHRALGFGSMATRKEKVSRWMGVAEPAPTAQLAMADLLGIDPEEIRRRGWPWWLLLAFHDDDTVLDSPWSTVGTVKALDDVGGPVDRRGFLIASTSTLSASLARWANADAANGAVTGGRHVGAHVADLFDTRLDALRHLDDEVGSSQVYDAASAELRLITRLLRDASYTEVTGRRLFGSAAEASRLAGWCAYDSGHTASAERHFAASLRAAASGGDATTGATALAFWANVRYSNHDPRGAVDMVDGALDTRRRIISPRVVAMLHARKARAHSTAGDASDTYRALDAAFAAYDRAGPAGEDLPGMYWLTHGELHQVAASSALTLGKPGRALEHFDAALAHHDPYDTTGEARGAAIYLARRAEAHIALGDLDTAAGIAHQVVDMMGGVDSARGCATLTDLRDTLGAHRNATAVCDFLDRTG
ncbi:transcriptional regulator [Embleya sp. NPDC005575]|uniref:transcriptional regulator n=1 Tax=Embleya sp. NPDC005575 TaxID=3156892 RepID=UPI0033B2A24E